MTNTGVTREKGREKMQGPLYFVNSNKQLNFEVNAIWSYLFIKIFCLSFFHILPCKKRLTQFDNYTDIIN